MKIHILVTHDGAFFSAFIPLILILVKKMT